LERANEINTKLLNNEVITPISANNWQKKLPKIVEAFQHFDCERGDLNGFLNQIFNNE
jgi:hypothetical protein